MIVAIPELAINPSPIDVAITEEFGEGVYDNSFGALPHFLEVSRYTINEDPFYSQYGAEYRELSKQADEAKKQGDEDQLEELHLQMREVFRRMEEAPADYGVCDDVSQIYAKWPELVEGDRKFVIGVTVIDAKHVPDWRWHKWGEYIGTHEPQHEHIGDEEGIDRVVCFSIIEILGHQYDED